MNFGPMLTAMATPFDRKGNLDLAKTSQLVNYLLEHGTDGLVVAGTTGESPTLTTEEKLALFSQVVEVADKRAPVIAGTGGNNTRASAELTKKAEQTGVDGALVVAPYYNKPSQEGLYQHFKAVAEATSLPIMLYNVPGRTVTNMTADTTIRLAEIGNITAVKEASGNLNQVSEIIENTDDDFLLYSGDDAFTLPIMALGGNGVVSVAAHVIGTEMKEMISLFKEGQTAKAAKLHRHLLPLMRELFATPSPVPVKTALQLEGLDVGGVRLPMVPLTETERLSLQRILDTTFTRP